MKRYIFLKANGEVAFESFSIDFFRANRTGAEFMRDRETGILYDVLPSGPLIDRLRVVAGSQKQEAK